jgi:hypothetical protein
MADKIKATVNPQQRLLVTNYNVSGGSIRMGDLFDVDTTTANDGALLSYSASTGQWQATQTIDNINTKINGGNY